MARAMGRFLKVQPRKIRMLVDMVRGMPVERALATLAFTPKRGAKTVAKVIETALTAEAEKPNANVDRMVVKEAFVNDGPTAGKWLPRAHGRATPLIKRSAHLTVVVEEKE